MSIRSAQPALTRAIAHVTASVTERGKTEGSKLPPLRRLAREAGVSILTMWKAIRKLREQGAVAVRHGSGIYCGPSVPQPAPTPAREPKWRALSSALMTDITGGAYRHREFLPSIKELSERYGAGYRTLSQALRALSRDNLLDVHKRRYRIRYARASRASVAILFLYHEGIARRYEWRGYRHRIDEFVRLLETECVSRNIRLDTRKFGDAGMDLRSLRSGDTQGTVIWGSDQDPFISRREELLPALARFRRPVFAFDDIGDMMVPSEYEQLRHFIRAGVSDFKAGRKAARFLLDSGHRHIAFFSNRYDAPWSRERWRGLESICCRITGNAASCTACTAAYSAPRRSTPGANIFLSQARQLEAVSSHAMRLLENPFDRESVYLVAQELRQYHEMRFTLAPLFKQAIENPAITAWVCADDAIAAHAALPFLAQRRRRDIGVLAFNNSIEIAWQHGITSYDFGLSQLVVRMINTILDPRIQGQEKSVEAQGMVIERGSILGR